MNSKIATPIFARSTTKRTTRHGEKLVYGEVEGCTHLYEYRADGVLSRARISMGDDEPTEIFCSTRTARPSAADRWSKFRENWQTFAELAPAGSLRANSCRSDDVIRAEGTLPPLQGLRRRQGPGPRDATFGQACPRDLGADRRRLASPLSARPSPPGKQQLRQSAPCRATVGKYHHHTQMSRSFVVRPVIFIDTIRTRNSAW